MMVLKWLLMLLAFVSGIAKIYGIEVERQGAELFGVDYRLIILMGILQLISVPLMYFRYYLGGVILLGVPYLFFVYLGFIYKQIPLSIFSLFIFCLTLVPYFASSN